jgi:ATP-dependent exoDNAse (exonuclease V) beta subunit
MLPAKVVTHIHKGIQTAYKSVGREAAQIGTIVHNWIESAIEYKMSGGTAPKVPKGNEVRNCIKAYKAWSRERKPVWLAAEQKVYYHDPGGVNCYAGTVDALAEIDGKLCIIDFKTSKKIYKPYHLQVAAYAQAISMQEQIDMPMAMILRFDKETGIFQEKMFDPRQHIHMFFHCLDLKAWNTARIKHEG